LIINQSFTLNGSQVGFETIDFRATAAAQTLTVGSTYLFGTAAHTITVASSTVGVTVDATLAVAGTATGLTIQDNALANVFKTARDDTLRTKTTVALSPSDGAKDVIWISDVKGGTSSATDVTSGGTSDHSAHITGFDVSAGANSDQLRLDFAGTVVPTFTTVSAVLNATDLRNKIIELDNPSFYASGATWDPTNAGNIENAIAAAIGSSIDYSGNPASTSRLDAFAVVYGDPLSLQLANQAAIVRVWSASNLSGAADLVPASIEVEIVGILTGVTAGSLTAANFLLV
jgi:hypothetical protein